MIYLQAASVEAGAATVTFLTIRNIKNKIKQFLIYLEYF